MLSFVIFAAPCENRLYRFNLVIGTAGGFVVGLAKSVPSALSETLKIVLRAQESIVTYTEYEYNALGQLSHMTMYEPGIRVPIVKTKIINNLDL